MTLFTERSESESKQPCDHKTFWHGKCYVYPGKWAWVLQCTKCRMIVEDPEKPKCKSPHASDKEMLVVSNEEKGDVKT